MTYYNDDRWMEKFAHDKCRALDELAATKDKLVGRHPSITMPYQYYAGHKEMRLLCEQYRDHNDAKCAMCYALGRHDLVAEIARECADWYGAGYED
jgi:hypothetical protein